MRARTAEPRRWTSQWDSENGATAELLIDQGADIHAMYPSGRAALHVAADAGRLEMVRLLDRGANPNIATREGLTPLHAALVSGFENIAEKIRAHGGN